MYNVVKQEAPDRWVKELYFQTEFRAYLCARTKSKALMCEDEGISPTKEVILFCAVNLWRKGRQDYANAIPAHKRQLFRCWERWTDLFLKEAVSLYPDGAGVTKADVEREAER